MGSERVEAQRRHTTVTSQNVCMKTWSKSRGTHGIALNGEDWYDVRHGRLIITPDVTAKEREREREREREIERERERERERESMIFYFPRTIHQIEWSNVL